MNLKNKKVLITGATGGIGNCIVKKFHDLEAKIFASHSYNFLTIEFPIPPDAPVIIMFLSFKSFIFLNFQYPLDCLSC